LVLALRNEKLNPNVAVVEAAEKYV
jgi:hypothetical protein